MLVNALEDYPQERDLLIKSIAHMKNSMKAYQNRELTELEMASVISKVRSLILNIRRNTLAEEVNQLDSFIALLESEEVESLVSFFGQEAIEVLWPVLTKDLPKGVPHDQSFYSSIR